MLLFRQNKNLVEENNIGIIGFANSTKCDCYYSGNRVYYTHKDY